ncbi:MAG: ABC transporter substrate-binding protein, partial [Antricoccus sp.]
TPALADSKVRAAMALALDRNGISKGLLGGACEPSAQIFPSSYWAASKKIPKSAIDYDAKKAKAMLVAAGYPDGFQMSLSSINAQQYSNVAEAVAQQLGKIGIKVDLQITEPVALIGNFVGAKTTDAYVSIWPGANDPSRTVTSLYMPTGLYNPGGLNIPQITSLAAEGLAGKTQDERANSYQALADATVENHMQLPICSASLPNAINGKVKNLLTTVGTALDVRNVEMTK